jgi:hypothetical protein
VQGWGIPWPYLGRPMAIPGEFKWPPVGRNRCPLTISHIVVGATSVGW